MKIKRIIGNEYDQNILFTQVLVYFCQLDTSLDISGKRESQLRNCLHQISLSSSLWKHLLINSWCGRAQLTMDSTTLRLVVLDTLRKQAEQAVGTKPVSSISPWPLGQFLPQVPAWVSSVDFTQPWTISVSAEINSFLSNCFWLWCLSHQ